MEAVKSGLGITSKNSQEGTEPVSGETGKGTSTEPYDQGNATGELFREFFLTISERKSVEVIELRMENAEQAEEGANVVKTASGRQIQERELTQEMEHKGLTPETDMAQEYLALHQTSWVVRAQAVLKGKGPTSRARKETSNDIALMVDIT